MSRARKVSFRSLVKAADKDKKDNWEPSYEFSGRTFQKRPAKPGKHVKTYP